MKKHTYYIGLSLILIFVSNSFALAETTAKDKTNKKIDRYINKTIKDHNVPGLALAVIKNGKVIHKNYYGKANIEHNVEVDKDTIFRIYSTTKLLTATAIFQLIEQDKITLEDSISKHIEGLPVNWNNIKIKHLLTHSSGLPEFFTAKNESEIPAKTYKSKKRFEKPGSMFTYTQFNYWLLDKIIEKTSGKTFENFIFENQFDNKRNGVLFSSNSFEIIKNRAKRYGSDNRRGFEAIYYSNPPFGHSGNGLNITLDNFIEWNKRLDNGKTLNDETKSLMFSSFPFTNGHKGAYGWGIYPVNDKKSYGFTGGGVSGFRKFLDNDLTIIFLTNGHKYIAIHNYVIDHVAGIVDKELKDEQKLREEKIILNLTKNQLKDVESDYKELRKTNPKTSLESVINSMAYTFISFGKVQQALQMFKFNAEQHPTSGNAFDSLGEGFYLNNQYKLALKNYKKSLELSPNNNNAKNMIKKIENILKKN